MNHTDPKVKCCKGCEDIFLKSGETPIFRCTNINCPNCHSQDSKCDHTKIRYNTKFCPFCGVEFEPTEKDPVGKCEHFHYQDNKEKCPICPTEKDPVESLGGTSGGAVSSCKHGNILPPWGTGCEKCKEVVCLDCYAHNITDTHVCDPLMKALREKGYKKGLKSDDNNQFYYNRGYQDAKAQTIREITKKLHSIAIYHPDFFHGTDIPCYAVKDVLDLLKPLEETK